MQLVMNFFWLILYRGFWPGKVGVVAEECDIYLEKSGLKWGHGGRSQLCESS